jgi:hypothetical protein
MNNIKIKHIRNFGTFINMWKLINVSQETLTRAIQKYFEIKKIAQYGLSSKEVLGGKFIL